MKILYFVKNNFILYEIIFQDIALYNEFTIDETLTYFGYLQNMHPHHLARRKEFLFTFLDLGEARTRLVKILRYLFLKLISYMNF